MPVRNCGDVCVRRVLLLFTRLQVRPTEHYHFHDICGPLGAYFIDVGLCKEVEYGYKKLCIRGTTAIITASLFIANAYVQYLPDEYLYCLWYIVGYCIVSALFQIYFISKEVVFNCCNSRISGHQLAIFSVSK